MLLTESLHHVPHLTSAMSDPSKYDAEPEKDPGNEDWNLIVETGFMVFFLIIRYRGIGSLDAETKNMLSSLEDNFME